MSADAGGPLAYHQTQRERFETERKRQDGIAARFSMVQLALFGLSVVLAGSGLFGGVSRPLLLGGLGAFVVFLIVRAFQGRVIQKTDAAEVRLTLHAGQRAPRIARLAVDRWKRSASTPARGTPPDVTRPRARGQGGTSSSSVRRSPGCSSRTCVTPTPSTRADQRPASIQREPVPSTRFTLEERRPSLGTSVT